MSGLASTPAAPVRALTWSPPVDLLLVGGLSLILGPAWVYLVDLPSTLGDRAWSSSRRP